MRTFATVNIGAYRMACVPGTYLGDCFLQNGLNFERHVVQALRERIRPGDTLLDVGAAWGYYTLVANHLTEGCARVISVEPNPGNVELLCRNIVENRIENAIVLSVGAGERWGTIGYAGGYENPIGKTKKSASTPVLVSPLAEVLHNIKPDIIKIDIEGFEPPAIRGLGAVATDARLIITEFCPEALSECGHSADEYWRLLNSLGFSRIYNLTAGHEQPLIPTEGICDLLLERR